MLRNEKLSLPRGQAWVSILDGVVISNESANWSETHVSSSGGGGYVGPYYGQYSPPVISSQVTSRSAQTLWLRDPDKGKDHSFQFGDFYLPAVNGHRVRVCWSGPVGASKGDYLLIENLDSGHFHDFKNGGWFDWAHDNKLIKYHPVEAFVELVLPFILIILVLLVIADFLSAGQIWYGIVSATIGFGFYRVCMPVTRMLINTFGVARWRRNRATEIRSQYLDLFNQ